MIVFLSAFLAFLFCGLPAYADPLTAAIVGWLGTTSAAVTAAVGFAVNVIAGYALTALQMAMQTKPKPAGLKTDVALKGGNNSASFMLGRYATPGSWICPPMSHGRGGMKTPNAFLTQVIAVSDMPGVSLSRLRLNGEWVEIEAGPGTDQFGRRILGKYISDSDSSRSVAYVKFYDGTQTAADPMLREIYGDYPDRPWTANMIGKGVAYAIMTYQYDRALFSGMPEPLFELVGIPLYDPRKDSSVGGSGSQRWANRSTWQETHNPAVMIYNIMRGIRLPDGQIWGGNCEAEDLPLSNWFTAMNNCDQEIETAGGPSPKYRAGFEVSVADDEPADVIEELLKACSGAMSELGGVWKIRTGGPGLPIYFLTDDDLLVSEGNEFEPFPSLNDSHNGLHGSFPDPAALYEVRDAPPLYNSTFLAEDNGREQIGSVSLPAVPYAKQVQRLMRAWLHDDRRWRRLTIPLGPYAAALEPLDSVSWSSEKNGFVSKVFEVDQASRDLRTCNTTLAIREKDNADYDYEVGFELPSVTPAPGWRLPIVQVIPGYAVSGITLFDTSGSARKPGILQVWDGSDQQGVRGVEWEMRLAGTTAIVLRGSISDVTAGRIVTSGGILAGQAYEVHARLLTNRRRAWSDWKTATAPTIKLGSKDVSYSDIAGDIAQDLQDLEDWITDENDTLAGRILANESLTAQQQALINTVRATLSSASLIPNGELLSADVTLWPGNWDPASIIPRGSNGAGAVISAPTPFVIRMPVAASTYVRKLTAPIGVKPGETLRASFLMAGTGTGFNGSVSLVAYFTNAQGVEAAPTGVASSGTKTSIGWQEFVGGGIKVPNDAASVVFGIMRFGTGAVNDVYLTQLRAWRVTQGEEDLATAQSTLAALVDTIDGKVTAQAEAQTLVEAAVGRSSASGQFRARVQATPAGALSRIGLFATASAGEDNSRSAGLFLEALAGNISQVIIVADRFAVVNGSDRLKPFVVKGGNLFIGGDVSIEGNLLVAGSITMGKVGLNEITVLRSTRGGGTSTNDDAWKTALSWTFEPTANVNLALWIFYTLSATSSSSPGAIGRSAMRIRWRGAVIFEDSNSTEPNDGEGGTAKISERCADFEVVGAGGTGAGTMAVEIYNNSSGAGSAGVSRIRLAVGEFKR